MTGAVPRVLLVGGALGGGGAEKRFSLLARHMFGGTADVAVLVSDESNPKGVYSLGWRGRGSYPRAILELRQIIRRERYDAVIGFSLFPAAVARLAILGLARRPALVAMEVSRPLAIRAEWKGTWRAPLMDVVGRLAFAGADAFAANSIDGLEENISHHGVDRRRSRRVHNLVDVEALAKQANLPPGDLPDEPPGALIVCTAGRLDQMKLIDTVVEALAEFPEDIPWRHWVLGNGPAEEDLRALVARLGLMDRVRFLGWRQNPHSVIARSHVFVQPSRFEGYSNSLMEAMAVGVPIVTSYHSSDARSLVGCGAALGFEPGDIRGLKEALLSLRNNPGVRKTMRAAAALQMEPMALERAIPEYEAVVHAALARRRTHPRARSRVDDP